jgi:monofunctional biosynthetic peptidoglycan transglycosylase
MEFMVHKPQQDIGIALADKLTKREAAGIAAILPNPRKFKASNSSSYINRRKDKIMRVMSHVGKIEY